MPDLVGPVRFSLHRSTQKYSADSLCSIRVRHGCTTVSLSVSGCIRLWTMWTASRRAELGRQVVSENSLIMELTL